LEIAEDNRRKGQYKVFCYAMKHKGEMSRPALRYAIEKLPLELKKKAMEKAS